MTLRAVDLFSGCGGMSLGFERAGIEVVQAVDHWESANRVYAANFEHPVATLDIASDYQAVRELVGAIKPDLIVGGPPCQDFSSAGKREMGARADLTATYGRLVTEIRPQWFVMENVERIKSSPLLLQACEHWVDAGYGLSIQILDASLCGAPQSRKRLFVVGQLGGQHGALDDIFQAQLAPRPLTVRDYLGDELGLDYYYRHPRSYARRGIFSVDEPSPTVRGVNRPVPPNYQLHPTEPQHIDLQRLRPLTEAERARLQTFPPDFQWLGTKTDLNQMIGNAVPVEQARFVAHGILTFLSRNQESQVQRKLFTESSPLVIPQKALKPA